MNRRRRPFLIHAGVLLVTAVLAATGSARAQEGSEDDEATGVEPTAVTTPLVSVTLPWARTADLDRRVPGDGEAEYRLLVDVPAIDEKEGQPYVVGGEACSERRLTFGGPPPRRQQEREGLVAVRRRGTRREPSHRRQLRGLMGSRRPVVPGRRPRLLDGDGSARPHHPVPPRRGPARRCGTIEMTSDRRVHSRGGTDVANVEGRGAFSATRLAAH